MLIIFDLDDTLIDTSGCITPIQLESALQHMMTAGLAISDETEALDLLKRLDQTADSARSSLSEFLDIMDGKEQFYSIGEKVIYGDFPSDIVILPLDDVTEILSELKETHQLALVTVGEKDLQFKKMEKAGIDSSIFSKIIVSRDRNKKPHYQAIMEELCSTPQETVVCGDRVTIDLAPAKELGCKTIHVRWGRGRGYHPVANSKADVDFAVTEFKHIKDIVAGL
ncbi:MAG: HAD family hydrolase [Rhabdochlamydiaceae bacterium]